jgi:hypothetical protein
MYPFLISKVRKSLIVNKLYKQSDKYCGEDRSNNRAASPTCSKTPGIFEHKTGTPILNASNGGKFVGPKNVGITRAIDLEYSKYISSLSTNPANLTLLFNDKSEVICFMYSIFPLSPPENIAPI